MNFCTEDPECGIVATGVPYNYRQTDEIRKGADATMELTRYVKDDLPGKIVEQCLPRLEMNGAVACTAFDVEKIINSALLNSANRGSNNNNNNNNITPAGFFLKQQMLSNGWPENGIDDLLRQTSCCCGCEFPLPSFDENNISIQHFAS